MCSPGVSDDEELDVVLNTIADSGDCVVEVGSTLGGVKDSA